MSYIVEKRQIEIKDSCDVLVAGGGIAGIAAALSAARNGAKVILLEREFMLGGLGTAGLVTIYLPLCDGRGTQLSYGIAEELLKLSISMGAEANSYPKAWIENGTLEEKKKRRYEARYNPQLFAILAEQLLIREGVTVLYGTQVASVTKENDRISNVIVENKSGRYAVSVRSVVDCTGDADICKFADEDCETFKQGNILAAWYYFLNGNDCGLKMLGASDIPDDEKTGDEPQPLVNRRFTGLDGKEISDMVVLSHKQILSDVKEMRKENEKHIPVTIPTIPQIRMTRRIKGVYTMTTEDDGRDFDDSVGMFGNWKKIGPVYQLPFSSLYGSRVKNLITAGRCISANDAMWDVTRVIPVCAVSGEAAGTAASMTDDFKSLDITELQNKLIENGVKIRL